MKFKDLLPYVIIVVLVISVFRGCDANTIFGEDYNQNETTIDTFIKYDTITIKKDSVIEKPIPVTKYDTIIPDYIYNKLDSLEGANDRINYLLGKLSIKDYDTTYKYNDSKFRLKEKVSGEIIERKVFFNGFEEREVREIKTTTTKTPSFVLSAGLSTSIQTDFNTFREPNIGAEIEFQNAKGYQLQFSYNTAEVFSFSIKKPIFVKY